LDAIRAFGVVGTDHYGADTECQITEIAVRCFGRPAGRDRRAIDW
jgi:hypothetical protein